MNKIFTMLFALIPAMGLMAQKTLTVHVTNQTGEVKTDAPVVLSLSGIGVDVQSALVSADGEEIPCQLDDLDRDGNYDELCFLANLQPKQRKNFRVELSANGEPRKYESRVYADMILRNPKSKNSNRHDLYISEVTAPKKLADPYHLLHMHGAVMENELIAFRFYFNEKQTIDLYGKYHKGLELAQTQFYPSKEQKAAGFGDDILWCGNAFGLGAFRGWDGNKPTMLSDVDYRTQRIVSYGPVRTIVELEDRGWKADATHPRIDLKLRYTLYAGSRTIDVSVKTNRNVDDMTFSTGLINVKGSKEMSNHKGLRGLWGTDYPAKDTVNWKPETVGMGIYIPSQYIVKELPADNENYTYEIRVPNREMNYKLTFGSNKEDFGYHSAKDWFAYLKDWRKQMDDPVKVEVE